MNLRGGGGKVYIFGISANLLDEKNSKHQDDEDKYFKKFVEKKPECNIGGTFIEKRRYFNKKAIESFKPALIIADEFHRYFEKMNLIGELIKECSEKTKLLLLSATPYIVRKDDWKEGDFQTSVDELIENEEKEKGGFSFSNLLEFLLNDKEKYNEYKQLWGDHKPQDIEEFLKSYIWRNERVVIGEKYRDIPEKTDFIEGIYDDCMEYEKKLAEMKGNRRFFSLCPGAWSFAIVGWNRCDGETHAKLYKRAKKEICGNQEISDDDFLFKNMNINSEEIKKCLRTRLIYDYAYERGKNLLWVPPTGPLYSFGGAFEEQKDFSKLLVFSGYVMVPRMVSTVFSELTNKRDCEQLENTEKVVNELEVLDKNVLDEKVLANLVAFWKPEKGDLKTIIETIENNNDVKQLACKLKTSVKILSQYIIASPLVCSYRILEDIENSKKVAEAFCRYFKQKAILKCLASQNCSTLNDLLEYCVNGNLQAMLYEYAFLEERWADYIVESLSYPGSNLFVLNKTDGKIDGFDIECRFAERYSPDGDDTGVSGSSKTGEGNQTTIERSFRSPFWPMILCTTSAGQEGIDFDAYCSRIMHYSIPATPMSFEQRDGRVDRRRSLLARRKMALLWGNQLQCDYSEFWKEMFKKDTGMSGLSPDWVQMNDKSDLKQERIIPFFPYSEEYILYRRLVDCKNAYRKQMGNPNETELDSESGMTIKLNNISV